jgi:hypothetical protein
MNCFIRKGIPTLIAILLVALTYAAVVKGQETTARQGFEKMKSLAGKWEATTEKGKKATLAFEVVANGTAVLERFLDEGANPYGSMVTLYHLDGSDLVLTHYCIANNQPRMRAHSITDDGIAFQFVSATNLPNPNAGHMYKASYRFHNADEFSTEWTFRQNGQDKFTEALRFRRVR